MPVPAPLLRAFAVAGFSLLVGCEKPLPARLEITASRPTFSTEGEIPNEVSSLQRLGFNEEQRFQWDMPDTWKLRPATKMRQLNFSFGPNAEGECYFSITKAPEDSTHPALDEINRWRKQMGQPPVEEVTSLPTLALLRQDLPSPYLKLTGTYTPASGMMMSNPSPSEPRPGTGLLGVVLEVPQMNTVLTIKMVGPQDLVAAEEAHFKSFVTSLAPAAVAP